MPGKPTPIDYRVTFSLRSPSRGRRLSSRLLRGGSFNNQASNVRSAYRNNNQPTNRNNNIGFRPSSTLRQDLFSAMPESEGHQRPLECASAKFRSLSRVGRALFRSAKSTIGPTGLVDRKTRTPCRVILSL